ncbi:hypothetical protein K7640_24065 [Micromonospora sp. PLK6-60]|uniref:hypothetical protein n=1 Tax=Micromonospora sp. PLK6-60 TaxID=2873383 RepID=UPI001CA7AED6|nr:hypothetical protein [Micromonospora sp. PLK6-60]MBY8874908.1 hypothetical protein [Micromonospora sp. PLK6-60]
MEHPGGRVAGRRQPVVRRAARREPNDSMVVAFLAGARVPVPVSRARAALRGAFLLIGLLAGAFFAAVARAVGLRLGVAVAAVAFFRAVRAVVARGFSAAFVAAVAPLARLVAVAVFFAAVRFGIGALRAPWALRALPPVLAAWAIVVPSSGAARRWRVRPWAPLGRRTGAAPA